MTLTLHNQAPVVVLVADINPAIFSFEWTLQHLFERTPTDEISVTDIVVQSDQMTLQLRFVDGVALNVDDGRIEFFMLNSDPATMANVENVILKILTVLPHTPFKAIGCNLSFIDDNPSDKIAGFFDTPEDLESHGVLNMRSLGVQLQLDKIADVLNFSRYLTDDNVRYSFNFHRSEADVNNYPDAVNGFIGSSITYSMELLKSHYGYEEFSAVDFIPSQNDGEADDVAQTAN